MFKTDIKSLSSLYDLPYFSIIKYFNDFLLNLYLFLLLASRYYASNYNSLLPEESKIIQEILSNNPQKTILIGTIISLLISFIVLASIEDIYSLKKSPVIKSSRLIKKYDVLNILRNDLYKYEFTPKGFDVALSTCYGTVGLLLLIFLQLTSNNQSLLSLSYVLIDYSVLFYTLMRSVFIIFNPHALINVTLLFLVIFFIPGFLEHKVIPSSIATEVNFWTPIILIYFLPLIIKIIKKRSS